jgi:hypothetical protein
MVSGLIPGGINFEFEASFYGAQSGFPEIIKAKIDLCFYLCCPSGVNVNKALLTLHLTN